MIQTTLRFALGAALLMGATVASAASVTAPMTVSATIQEFPGPSLRCASKFGATLTGAGTSPTLGRVVMIGSDCITPDGPVLNFNQGRIIIVTANGDQLYGEYMGQVIPTGEGTKYVFNGATYRITGGTGRNFRATGGGTLTGGGDLLTGAGKLEISGSLTTMGW